MVLDELGATEASQLVTHSWRMVGKSSAIR
jgi:hypothetical protein